MDIADQSEDVIQREEREFEDPNDNLHAPSFGKDPLVA